MLTERQVTAPLHYTEQLRVFLDKKGRLSLSVTVHVACTYLFIDLYTTLPGGCHASF